MMFVIPIILFIGKPVCHRRRSHLQSGIMPTEEKSMIAKEPKKKLKMIFVVPDDSVPPKFLMLENKEEFQFLIGRGRHREGESKR